MSMEKINFFNIQLPIQKRPIMFFGAGLDLRLLVLEKELQYMDYNFELCSDSNALLYGTSINYKLFTGKGEKKVSIISIDEMLDKCRDDLEMLVVISSSRCFNEINKQLLSYGIKNEIIGITEFRYIFEYEFFNRYVKLNGNEFMCDYFEYKHLCRIPSMIENFSIIDYLKNGQELYGMICPPKTGSSSVYSSLQKCDCNILRAHSSSYVAKLMWQPYLKKYCKKYILGVRDPIAQNISMFYQFAMIYNAKKEMHCSDTNALFGENVVQMLLNPDAIHKDNLWYMKWYHSQELYRSGDALDTGNVHVELMVQYFFDGEIKTVFGFDVFNTPFDQEKGFAIIRDGERELFIYQIEKLNQLEKELGTFFELPSFRLQLENVGEEKYYSNSYSNFLQNFKAPKEYFDISYSCKYTKHFYSDCSIEDFKRRWESNIEYLEV